MATEDSPASREEGPSSQGSNPIPVTEHRMASGATPEKDSESLNGPSKGSPDEKLKWLSGIIGVSTAVLGSFTVFYDKVVLPNTAPISITLDLDIKSISMDMDDTQANQEIKGIGNGHKGQSIVLRASAKNNGPRRLTLLKPHWVMYGINGALNDEARDKLVLPQNLAVKINKGFEYDVDRVNRVQVVDGPNQSGKRLIALGQLFNDLSILPQQVVTSERVVVIPIDKAIQFLEVAVNIPSIPEAISGTSESDIQWKGCLTGMSVEMACDFDDVGPSVTSVFQWKNSFCEIAPFSEKALNSKEKRPRDILNLFSIRTYYTKSKSLNDSFCQPNGVIFSKDRLDRIGAQVHTATREVPIRTAANTNKN
jgi:hypothetical protein